MRNWLSGRVDGPTLCPDPVPTQKWRVSTLSSAMHRRHAFVILGCGTLAIFECLI